MTKICGEAKRKEVVDLISFQPTDEETAFITLAKTLAEEVLRPAARSSEEERQAAREWTIKANELGFAALELPERWGGMEMTLISQVQILEALSNGDLALVQGLPGPGDAASFMRLAPENQAFAAYRRTGEDGQWPTVAFLNACDPGVSQTINITGASFENGYVIKGISRPVKMAAFAAYLLLAAPGPDGKTRLFWLDKEQTRWRAIPGDYRLGLLASGWARVQFDDLTVTKDAVVAEGRDADRLLSRALARLRVLEAAKEVGLMTAALSYATEYTATRRAFGQELAKFQGVSFQMADMAIAVQAARLLVWRAASALDREEPEAPGLSLDALSRSHRSLRLVTDSAVQLLGGHGYVQDHPVEKWMRDAAAQIALNGGEQDLLLRRGEQLLTEERETVS